VSDRLWLSNGVLGAHISQTGISPGSPCSTPFQHSSYNFQILSKLHQLTHAVGRRVILTPTCIDSLALLHLACCNFTAGILLTSSNHVASLTNCKWTPCTCLHTWGATYRYLNLSPCLTFPHLASVYWSGLTSRTMTSWSFSLISSQQGPVLPRTDRLRRCRL
jgi:hypothetical protein